MSGGFYTNELKWAREAGTAWYRSKEPVPIDHPFVGGGYLSNKKWPLNEGNTIFISYSLLLQFLGKLWNPKTPQHTHTVNFREQFGKLPKKIKFLTLKTFPGYYYSFWTKPFFPKKCLNLRYFKLELMQIASNQHL